MVRERHVEVLAGGIAGGAQAGRAAVCVDLQRGKGELRISDLPQPEVSRREHDGASAAATRCGEGGTAQGGRRDECDGELHLCMV